LIAAFQLFVQSPVPSLQLSHNSSFITMLFFIYSFWRVYRWPGFLLSWSSLKIR